MTASLAQPLPTDLAQLPLRVVVCARSQPRPAIGGAPLRNLQNLEALSRLGETHLFSLFKGTCKDAQSTQAPALASWSHADLAQPRSLGDKLRNRLRWLRPQGHYYFDWIYTAAAARQFEQVLTQVQPHWIVFEELWVAPYLAVAVRHRQRHPGCKIVLDNHNVEGLLAAERYPLSQAKTRAEWIDFALRPRRVKHWERWAIAQADQVWVCSSTDAEQLQHLYGVWPGNQPENQPGNQYGQKASALAAASGKFWVVPNGVDVPSYTTSPPVLPSASPALPHPTPSILFLGSFAYGPNADAAQLLIEAIYPRLQAHWPHLRLLLVGHEPTPLMQQAAQVNPHIIVTGQVESVLPYLHQADVLVVPLRQGSGTRLKILEAFAARLPVVSTTKGAEGLAVEDGQQILLRDDLDDLADAVGQLLADPVQRQAIATQAHQTVEQLYSWATATQTIQAALGQCL